MFMRSLLGIILWVITFIQPFSAGTIKPTSSPPPIYNSLANAGVRADYVFSFTPESYLPKGGFLKITFPS